MISKVKKYEKARIKMPLSFLGGVTIRDHFRTGGIILFMTAGTYTRIVEKLEVNPDIAKLSAYLVVENTIVKDLKALFIKPQKWAKVSKGKHNRLFGFVYNNKEGDFYLGDFTAPDEKNRKIKTGRLFSALFPRRTDAEIERLVSLWNSYYKVDTTFLKIKEDVPAVYNMPHACKGSIGNSCMRGHGEYYEELKNAFGDKLKVLTYEVGGELLGRALLWEEVEFKNYKTQKFMDRIYSTTPAIENLFKKWAKENGYIIKAHQSYDCPYEFIDTDGNYFEDKAQVLPKEDINFRNFFNFPYLDTFKWVCEDYLLNWEPDDYIGTATNTDGSLDDEEFTVCDYCEERVHQEEITYLENYDRYVCDNCLGNYYRWSDYHDCYLYEDDAYWCVDIEDYTDEWSCWYDDYLDEYVSDNQKQYSFGGGYISEYALKQTIDQHIWTDDIYREDQPDYDVIIDDECNDYVWSDYFGCYFYYELDGYKNALENLNTYEKVLTALETDKYNLSPDDIINLKEELKEFFGEGEEDEECA